MLFKIAPEKSSRRVAGNCARGGVRFPKSLRIQALSAFTGALLIVMTHNAHAQTPGQGTAPAEKAAQAYNAFGFDLLARTEKALPGQNLFLSPASAALAMAMVQNGAEGATRDEMAKTLRVEGLTPSQLNEADAALLDRLSDLDPKVQLRIANGIWTHKEASIRPDFTAVNQKYYHAEVAAADFANPETVQQINQWASRQTAGKINGILQPPLDPLLRLIVLNAIYFKGDWTIQFDKKLTRDLLFTLSDGRSAKRPRMSRSGTFDYYENADLQAVSLPYGGRKISMIVCLPKHGLDAFVQNLNSRAWTGLLSSLASRKGRVELPRFKLEGEYDLTGTLAAMGMPRAFNRDADLSGISPERLFISWVKQKTYVDVNEEGTEAAAVTAVGVGRAMVVRQEPPPFELIVDRPFFVALRDNQTGLVLFLGTILDPGHSQGAI